MRITFIAWISTRRLYFCCPRSCSASPFLPSLLWFFDKFTPLRRISAFSCPTVFTIVLLLSVLMSIHMYSRWWEVYLWESTSDHCFLPSDRCLQQSKGCIAVFLGEHRGVVLMQHITHDSHKIDIARYKDAPRAKEISCGLPVPWKSAVPLFHWEAQIFLSWRTEGSNYALFNVEFPHHLSNILCQTFRNPPWSQ